MSKNIRALSTTELCQRLALYRSLKSRGVYDEIMISIMEHELDMRKQKETA
jgi:hypothetical protein